MEGFAELLLSERYWEAIYLLERRPDVYYILSKSPLEICKRAIIHSSHLPLLLLNIFGVINPESDIVEELLEYCREQRDPQLFIYLLAPISPMSHYDIYNIHSEHPLLQQLGDIDLTLSLPQTVSKYAHSLLNTPLLDIIRSPHYSTAGTYLHLIGETGLHHLLLLFIKYYPLLIPPLLLPTQCPWNNSLCFCSCFWQS